MTDVHAKKNNILLKYIIWSSAKKKPTKTITNKAKDNGPKNSTTTIEMSFKCDRNLIVDIIIVVGRS